MTLFLVKLLVDFGLMVLIWIIQLIVYPGLSYYQRQNLVKWHQIYTFRIGIIVMPLMLCQLALSVIRVYEMLDFYRSTDLILIIMVWLSTFLQFVPLHSKISQRDIDSKLIHKLINLNWFRTCLWTLIFSWNLYTYLN